ncbi:peptidylprolyl isomerase [Polaribacter sp. ALD11]|uniref:peptidylprolyl isomerase n=1 Tax=Polaribacter sp. ALD11 TaxID=2058137 RepID=UPI000C314DB9|nr:peptidylprolyl isomerase [Polaribacter sp. ALD11]AUC84744.1 peptidylprolyl isomerase [Polaribacter sp. ALD11]
MKKRVLFICTLFFSLNGFSQEGKTLVTINKEKTTVADFKRVYEKNLDVIDSEEAKDVAKNLELYINYKLKVKEAYQLKLDTLPSYIREIASYKNQLSAPYLQDTTFITALVKDVYFRTKNEVKAKHILIRTTKDATPKDTLASFNKILEIRNRIIKGEDFEKVAAETSEDKSAQDDSKTGRKGNNGNLGYFNAFKMVPSFEDAAYTTKVGAVSMPFRSQFGYHILKVDDFRVSKGELETAHILITDTTKVGKTRIDEVYAKLQQKEAFEKLANEYSDDKGSKANGGKLNKFGTGRMVKPFEDAAFSLKNEGDFSKPFRTRFGWHIVKLLKTHAIKPFAEMKKELTAKIKSSSRMQMSETAVVNKLTAKYSIVENEEAKEILNRKNIRAIAKDSLQNIIISINNKNITQETFVKYIRNRRHIPVYVLFDMFKSQEILSYYKENLIYTEPEYAYTLNEYEDGLLLFELMQQKIWNKSSKDTLGLKTYFLNNKGAYNSNELKNIKGKVINDYQNFLEKNWIADLRNKNKIKVNKRQLKNLIKFYDKK